MQQQISVPMTDPSRVSEARLAALQMARSVGFDEEESAKVGIVATELATNLTKHAVRGEFLTGIAEWNGIPTVEILSLDAGPGIANMAACLRDGYSTAGSPGTGLGAVARLSSSFDVYTNPDRGAAFHATIHSTNGIPKSKTPPQIHLGAVCIAKPGEEICGDSCAVSQERDRCIFVVVDGLGHGSDAAAVAHEAIAVFKKRASLGPATIVELMHRALRTTRGGAVAVAELNLVENQVRFAGVGNVAGVLVGRDKARHMVSSNGIVGHDVRHIREFSYPWAKDVVMVMHSDGLGTKWNLGSYAGIQRRSPGIMAGVLYRDFTRRQDDVTVLVAKASEESP